MSEHSLAGDRERDDTERRDDILDQDYLLTGKDLTREDRESEDVWQRRERERDELFRRTIDRDNELYNLRMLQLQKDVEHYGSTDRRASDRNEGLLFRDASTHSTAMGGIEEEIEENALAEDAPADKA